MGSVQGNLLKDTQTVTNEMITNSRNTCIANCSNIMSGNTTVIENVDAGSLNFSQSCTASANCTMSNQLSDQVTTILAAQAQQSQSTQRDLINFSFTGQLNSIEINQSTTTRIANILSNTCQANNSNLKSNDITYLANDKFTGAVDFSQTGNSSATCAMNNLSKIVVFNKDQAKTSQTQKITSAFAMVIIAIVICLIVGGIVMFLLKKGGDKKDKEANKDEDLARELRIAEEQQKIETGSIDR